MIAFTIDTDSLVALFQNWGWPQWLIVGGLAAMWVPGPSLPVLINKLKGLFNRSPAPDDPFPIPPDVVDDMPLLIHQMRLCVCDEEPAVRDGCNKHLDEIETLIGGTEIDANE